MSNPQTANPYPVEPRTAGPHSVEPRTAGPHPAESQAANQHSTSPLSAGPHPADLHSAELHPAAPHPVESLTAAEASAGGSNAPDGAAIANKLAALGVGGNVALCIVKFAAGVLGGSAAMVSDAVHSASDVLATAIAYIGVRIAGRAADEGHPYGHDRFECLASLALAFILFAAGLGIGYAGVKSIVAFAQAGGDAAAAGLVSDAPLWLALGAAVVSIVAKEAMSRYTRHWARIMNSPAFLADAKHHRSDALSSVGALVGIGASMLGFPLGDPLASVVICVFIVKMAWDVASDAVNRMMDAPCSPETEDALRTCIAGVEGVHHIDLLHTRMFGARYYVDAEIAADGNMSLTEAHDIAHAVHDKVEGEFPLVKHVMIHVNPA